MNLLNDFAKFEAGTRDIEPTFMIFRTSVGTYYLFPVLGITKKRTRFYNTITIEGTCWFNISKDVSRKSSMRCALATVDVERTFASMCSYPTFDDLFQVKSLGTVKRASPEFHTKFKWTLVLN